jgi:hypothetical protein
MLFKSVARIEPSLGGASFVSTSAERPSDVFDEIKFVAEISCDQTTGRHRSAPLLPPSNHETRAICEETFSKVARSQSLSA